MKKPHPWSLALPSAVLTSALVFSLGCARTNPVGLECDPNCTDGGPDEGVPSMPVDLAPPDLSASVDGESVDPKDPPVHRYSLRLSSELDDEATALVPAPGGGVYVAGTHRGPLVLAPPPGVLSHQGGTDGFVLKYRADGSLEWSLSLGGFYDDVPAPLITLDDRGDLLLAGSYRGQIQIGPVTLKSEVPDVYLARISSSFHPRDNPNALQVVTLSPSFSAEALSLAYDRLRDQPILVGRFTGKLDFGGVRVPALSHLSPYDVFVARFSKNLGHLRSERFGPVARAPHAVHAQVDAQGALLLSGSFASELSFGGASLVPLGGLDTFVTKLDADLRLVWQRQFGGADEDVVTAMSIVPGRSEIYVGGHYRSAALSGRLGSGPCADPALVNQSTLSQRDGFVLRLSGTGDCLYAKQLGGSSDDGVFALSADAYGGVVVAGHFSANVAFGPGIPPRRAQGADLFFARYDRDGNYSWDLTYGGSEADAALALYGVNPGYLYVAGYTSSPSLTLGGPALLGRGYKDVFVALYRSPERPPM